MKTLVTVMAHAEAQSAVERHSLYWQAHGCDRLVVCPADSMIDGRVLALGKKDHHGPGSIARFRALLAGLVQTQYNWHVIFEYDSLCLAPQMPVEIFRTAGLWANAFENHEPQFKGSHFFHPPLAMDRGTLGAIVQAMASVEDNAESGFWDRWLGLVVTGAGIPWHDYQDLGFSRNTIEPEMIPQAIEAVAKGAVMIHGIKTKECLESLQRAYDRAKANS